MCKAKIPKQQPASERKPEYLHNPLTDASRNDAAGFFAARSGRNALVIKRNTSSPALTKIAPRVPTIQ